MPIQKISKTIILNKALELFTENGYENTSMQTLADACKVSKANLYHHFKNKKDILNTLLLGIQKRFEKEIFSIAYEESLPHKERLEKMLELWKKVYSHKKNGRLIGNLIANAIFEKIDIIPDYETVIKSIVQDWVKALVHIYKSKYNTEESEKLAWESVKNMQGAVVLMRLFNDFSFIETSFSEMLEKI